MVTRISLSLILCLGSAMLTFAQEPQKPATRAGFQPFRYDEDWSFLADTSRASDWLDRLKYMSLGREDWFYGKYRFYHISVEIGPDGKATVKDYSEKQSASEAFE